MCCWVSILVKMRTEIKVYSCRESLSCTHVSALLHALVALSPPPSLFLSQSTDPQPSTSSSSSNDSEVLPVTSYLCTWKAPRKRKESTQQMSEIMFEKHVLGRTKKKKYLSLEEFDPRPEFCRGRVKDHLPTLLDKVRGKGLCISLLLDSSTQVWSNEKREESTTPTLPGVDQIKKTVEEFKKCLAVTEERAREIEQDSREQRNSQLWFNVRRYRLTASHFGDVYRRKPSTPPDSLVLRIINKKSFTSPSTEWGISNEKAAISAYVQFMKSRGHDIVVCGSGFLISSSHPFLGASPDGAVYDPTSAPHPYGYLEVKCPYAHRDKTPEEACSSNGFCSTLQENCDGTLTLNLRKNHVYYAQVQGQMAIGERPWCDFVIYTTKGISVQRISFDDDYWNKELLPQLISFYDNCIAPEIVSPVHSLGLPLRDLRCVHS